MSFKEKLGELRKAVKKQGTELGDMRTDVVAMKDKVQQLGLAQSGHKMSQMWHEFESASWDKNLRP